MQIKKLSVSNESESEISSASPVTGNPPKQDDPDDSGPSVEQKKTESARYLAKRIVMWFCLGVAASIVIVHVLHLLLPVAWRWLEPSDLDTIKGFSVSILSGVASSIAVGVYLRK